MLAWLGWLVVTVLLRVVVAATGLMVAVLVAARSEWATLLLPPLSPESVSPASCRRVGLVSWSKGGLGVGWMGRCGVLDGCLGCCRLG